jgi:hypothetical protein
MNQQTVFIALTSIPSAVGLVYLVFWRYRELRIDSFRQQLFELRGELFDFADAGNISFDDRAYGVLRSTINGFIRFGHRMTLWHLLSLALMADIAEINETESFDARWAKVMKPLPSPVREQMEEYRARMELLAIKHVLLVAPEFLIIVLPVLTVIFVWVAGKHAVAAMSSSVQDSGTMWRRLRPSNMEALDTAAFLYGQPARV